jgi:hypothetical protein
MEIDGYLIHEVDLTAMDTTEVQERLDNLRDGADATEDDPEVPNLYAHYTQEISRAESELAKREQWDKEIDRRAKAAAEAEARTPRGRLKQAKADLAAVEKTIADNPLPKTLELETVEGFDARQEAAPAIEARGERKRLLDDIAELEARVVFQDFDDDELADKAELAQIERERLQVEAREHEAAGRGRAADRANRLASELAQTIPPLLREKDARTNDRLGAIAHERRVHDKALHLRDQEIATWTRKVEELKNEIAQFDSGQVEFSNTTWEAYKEAQTAVTTWKRLKDQDRPPTDFELERAEEHVQWSDTNQLRRVGKNGVEVVVQEDGSI